MLLEGEEVLVVDDDVAFLELSRRFLDAAGLRTWTAERGDDALAIARSRRLRAVVLDFCLAGEPLSGKATLQALKREPQTRNLPVIVISGIKHGPEDELAAHDAGADSFLVKGDVVDQDFRPILRQIQAICRSQNAPP